MLRIVEIENQSAKSEFLEGKTPREDANANYDCTKPTPTATQPDTRGRRISFQDNNARPSNILGTGTDAGTTSPARKRSPPPASSAAKHDYLDDDDSDGTSSDDYDDPDSYIGKSEGSPKLSKERPVHDAYSHEEDAALELADDELDPLSEEAEGLSLTRFASGAAQPPRMIRSDSSSSEEEGPESPPQLPMDVDVRELMGGEQDEELADLYHSVRGCPCHGHGDNEDVPTKPAGFWDVPAEKCGGKRLALVAITA